MIVGIDEVGRGAWAGPLVVGAVMLGGKEIPDLTDSKKLSAKKRNMLARIIKNEAIGVGLGWVSAERIDQIGLSRSLTLASRLALKEIEAEYDQIVIDGTFDFLGDPRVTTMKQADLLVPSVSAASIIAKVARDYYMSDVVGKELPHYGFETHVGYGTAVHKKSLDEFGATHLHRLSFDPVKRALGQEMSSHKSQKISSSIGRQAELMAARFLEKRGYTILETNWRTKLCEIDIVAQKDDSIHLVEVKYRRDSAFGDGIAAITARKLAQMKFAARVWQHFAKWQGNIQLDVIALDRADIQVTDWIRNIS